MTEGRAVGVWRLVRVVDASCAKVGVLRDAFGVMSGANGVIDRRAWRHRARA